MQRSAPKPPESISPVANQRTRMALYASAANLIATGTQVLTNILTVRLTLPYLGEERFGVWMTVLGMAGLLTFADMGMGNALVTRVAAARANSAGAPLSVVVTGGLAALMFAGLCATMILSLASFLIPWHLVFQVPLSPKAQAEFQSSVHLFSLFFGLLLLTSGIRRVYDGLQEGFVAHTMTAVSSVTSLILMYFASAVQSDVPILLVCTFGVTTTLPLLLLCPLYWRGYFSAADVFGNFSHEWRNLIGTGSQYTLVQFGSIIMAGSEPLLVSSCKGSAALASMAISQKLFLLATTPTRILVAPYWGAYADARAKGDTRFVWRTLRAQLLFSAALTFFATGFLVVFSEQILAVITKATLRPEFTVVLACAALCIVDGILLPFGIYLNGIGCVRPQAIATSVAVVTYFPVKIIALLTGGVAAMIWTTAVFQVAYTILFYGVIFREQVWEPTRGEQSARY